MNRFCKGSSQRLCLEKAFGPQKQGNIDLRTVQELLGHRDITTTMRYAHFAPNHASRTILEVQRLEAAELAAGEKQEEGQRLDFQSSRMKQLSALE